MHLTEYDYCEYSKVTGQGCPYLLFLIKAVGARISPVMLLQLFMRSELHLGGAVKSECCAEKSKFQDGDHHIAWIVVLHFVFIRVGLSHFGLSWRNMIGESPSRIFPTHISF